MSLTLHLIDEVNCKLEGLSSSDIKYISEKMKLPIPGAYMLASVRSGNSDGCESLFDDEGFFALYQLEEVLNHLSSLGYDEDEIEIEDHRGKILHPVDEMPEITADYLSDFGFTYWDHQLGAIRSVLAHEKGILDVGTSGGKTLTTASISYIYDPYYPSILVTTMTKLVKDAAKLYDKLGLDYAVLDASKTPKQRRELIKTHRHFITTRKIAINHAEDFEGFRGVLLIDELHIGADKWMEVVNSPMGFSECPIRVGLTGSLPDKRKDPLKLQKIHNMIGGDVLTEVLPGELMEKGYAANLDIRLVKLNDEIGREKMNIVGSEAWDWDFEFSHYNTCVDRVKVIASFIRKNCPRNTLIIARPQVARLIADELECDCITQETSEKDREVMYSKFDTEDDYILSASIGTTGTGLSIDLIHYGVVVDIGESPSVAGQSVGRFLRKDQEGDKKDSAIVYDIYSNLKYGSRHKSGRLRYYKERGFSFQDNYATLNVYNEDLDFGTY